MSGIRHMKGAATMEGLMIAEQDIDVRKQIADLLIDAGYTVTVTSSAANALHGILKKTAQIVILGNEFDELAAGDLIPLLRKCNRDLTIILVSDEIPLPAIRKVRREGIFYHALKQDTDEICQAVQCAVQSMNNEHAAHR